MATMYLALRSMQCLPNGLGGTFMALDVFHGKARGDFVTKMGYPAWFPTCLGAFKLTQLALNWVADGAYVPIAQALMAFQLGGAYFTHAVVEKKGYVSAGARA
jgi:hypothetical protein